MNLTAPDDNLSAYSWNDAAWMKSRDLRHRPDAPIAIYEIHLDSWMRVPEENQRMLTCEEIAPKLADYMRWLNFTHVAILSTGGRPFQGQPRELLRFIDCLHGRDIGVIADSQALGGSSEDILRQHHADGLVLNGSIALAAAGGSLFKLKADCRWQQDVLYYFSKDPVYRKYHQDQLTARLRYAFSDHFFLPLSHWEVLPGRGSLLARMPGDDWRKFANLRLLFAFLHAQPGKKLIFMGAEFGQWAGWNQDASLDWHLVRAGNPHWAMQRWVGDLNQCYRREPALHQTDANPEGFEWADFTDTELSTLSWLRRSTRSRETILALFNFTPVPRHNYRLGVPGGGFWREILNSDSREYGGSGQGNFGGVEAAPFGWQSRSHSITVTLPPLGALFLKRES